MKAPQLAPRRGDHNLNHLRLGTIYRALTRTGASVGEYLGMETAYGTHSILLRHRSGTDSIALGDVMSILPQAA